MAGMQEERRRGRGSLRPSTVALVVVLAMTAIGAISLVRQRPIALPPPPQTPAWAMDGHDAARTGHSLSYPAPLPLTLRWWLRIPLGARSSVIDGAGNVYLAQPDGALLALDSGGNTRWCAALQPITDTSCTGAQAPPPPQGPPPPVTPNATIGSDGYLYVVGAGGVLRAFDPSRPVPLWHAFLGLVPEDGVAFNPGVATFYGVVSVPRPDRRPAYAVTAFRWKGQPVAGWHTTPILSRGLTPVSIAPDGTLLVAASAPAPGGPAALYALDGHGAVRWRVAVAPGRPSYAAAQGAGSGWLAWAAVAGAERSWVVVVDRTGRVLWRWSTGHPLDVDHAGVTLARRSTTGPAPAGLAYVGSAIGVYALDLTHRHAWLFFDARAPGLGGTGAPTTDLRGTVYVATASGRVYSLLPGGKQRWRYDTGRAASSALTLDPAGNVLLLSRDADGATVAEELGPGGTPLSTATALACAAPDCPTPTPTLAPTSTLTATGLLTPASPAATPLTATVTVTPLTPTEVTATPLTPTAMPLTPTATLTLTVPLTPSLTPSVTPAGTLAPTTAAG